MEQFQKSCKLIMFANSASGLIPAVQSRVFAVFQPAFEVAQITQILEKVE